MRKEKLEELCDRLKANDAGLLSITLDHEDLGTDGARLLAEALKKNVIVNRVSLYYCNLGYEGIKAIFEGLTGRGVKTRINISEDCTAEEEGNLREILKQPPKKKKTRTKKYKKHPDESYRNGKGLDEDVSKYANYGLGMDDNVPEDAMAHQRDL